MLCHVKVKTLAELLIVLRRRRLDPVGNDVPTVFFYANWNWLARKFAKRKGGANTCIAFMALALAVKFKGTAVVVCVDGESRHHSKKATTKQNASPRRNKQNSTACFFARNYPVLSKNLETAPSLITAQQKENLFTEITKIQSRQHQNTREQVIRQHSSRQLCRVSM